MSSKIFILEDEIAKIQMEILELYALEESLIRALEEE